MFAGKFFLRLFSLFLLLFLFLPFLLLPLLLLLPRYFVMFVEG